jgi:hypothetical protein
MAEAKNNGNVHIHILMVVVNAARLFWLFVELLQIDSSGFNPSASPV